MVEGPSLVNPQATRPFAPGYGIKPASEGELLAWSWAEERLTASRGYWLATVRPDGRPHLSPIWGVWVADSFCFGCSDESSKARNLRASPRAYVSVESTFEPVAVEGIVEPIAGEMRDDYRRAYQAKYDVDVGAIEGTHLRLVPRVAFGSIDDERFPEIATRWTFA